MRWQSIPLYGIAKKKQIVNCTDRELLSVYLGKGVVPFSSQTAKRTNVTSTDLSKYQAVDYGDFVLNNQQAWRGSVGVSKYSGIVSPAYIVLSLSDINIRFADYLFQSRAMIDQYVRCSKGVGSIQRNIYWLFLKRVKLFLPPRSEQDQIVRYLDWQVSKTNKLISALKKQIALLKEQKQVIINEAVTKGLDPSIPMKDSGVEWIGKIPNHWNVVYLFQMATEQFVSNRTVHNQNLLSLSYGKIKNKDINSTDGLLPASFDTYQVIKSGNIILRLTDLQNDHTSLRVGLSTQSGIITSAYTCLLPDVSVLPEYLYLLLHSFDVRKVFYGMGGGVRQSIGYKDMKKLPVLQFSLQEQQKIAAYCLKKQSHIEECIERLEKEISLLGEYRTLLISDVVTGQIDVRDVTVPEFEYVSEETSDTSDDEDIDTEEPEDEEA